MIVGKVTGTVVCTQKDKGLQGQKMLVVQPVNIENLKSSGGKMVALDSVGAGEGELVVVVGGSSARMAEGYSSTPVDYCIIGIVDSIEVNGKMVVEERRGSV
ncbi:ethanolamine utilization protein EutN [Lachnospiraceae bacterium KGMB03038]|nr:ethanolamine utilization protein EutN [Lachnospiraceae bacterium KGMB03038]